MKMILLIALVLCCAALPALGENRVVDEAGLFTGAQEAILEEKIGAIREKYQMDVAIVTNQSLDGKEVKLFAADFFEAMDYGMGPGKDGLIFLISMGARDYCTVTHGSAIRIFTDWGIDAIHAQVQPYLSDGDYYDGMEKYLSYVERYLIQAETDVPYDVFNQVELRSPLERANDLLFAILIGAAAIALIVVLIFKAQMKTVRRKAEASSYVENGSFHLSRSQDIYLYTTTRRRKIETNSGGRSGGGSTTFRSSSGGSFGGRSGKF